MMENHHYILLPDHTVKVVSLMEWARWFADAKRTVEKTNINDEVDVSTVFLGIDYRFGPGEPLIFETMIFGGEHDQYTDRYTTWDEAVEGHKKAVALASKS